MTKEELQQKIKEAPNIWMKRKYMLELKYIEELEKGEYVNILIRTNDKDKIINLLLDNENLLRTTKTEIIIDTRIDRAIKNIFTKEKPKSLLGTSKMIIKNGKPVIQ